MADDLIYFTSREPIADKNGTLTQSWVRYFESIGRKIKILDGAVSVSATAGTATMLPALPAGYMTIDINGTKKKMPYYNE